MPLKPQRPPCFDPSQQGGPTVQAWLFTLNVFFDANYVSEDTAKVRYTVSLLRGPAMDWWRVIVTKPMDYATLPTWEGQTGPWAPSYFVEVPQYCTWDAWCAVEGVEIDPKKIATIQVWHAPTNLTELHSFLEFVNHVRRFIPDMAKLTAPLTDLLRKGVEYTWGEKEQVAFSALKQILCSPPVLHIADPHRPFELVTDASDIAVGAVLLQDFGNGLQPIAYESRKIHPPERNYPIHDRKMLAIVHAFKVWRCYLTRADVTVRSDHRSLQYLRAQPNLNPRQIRWLDYLESNFHYTVTYKKGASNIADALICPAAQLHAILLVQTNPLLTGLFTHGYSTDPFFMTKNSQQLAEAKGVYYVKTGTNRIWVPTYSLLRELLLQEAHDGITPGHFGVEKTRQQLQRYYYWPELLTDVQHHVGSCPTCQVMKSSRKRKAGQLQPIPPPERAWQQVTMDFVTGLPSNPGGNDVVMVVVDRKWLTSLRARNRSQLKKPLAGSSQPSFDCMGYQPR
ncbi:unnamed protein product [Closterium sp. NIES-53]